MAVQVKVDTAAVGQLMRGESMRAEIQRRVNAIARAAQGAAGPEQAGRIEATARVERTRVHGSVFWVGGLVHEVRHRILGRALDAGR
jgi:hypothetical protein